MRMPIKQKTPNLCCIPNTTITTYSKQDFGEGANHIQGTGLVLGRLGLAQKLTQ